jgi:hypothetical protein
MKSPRLQIDYVDKKLSQELHLPISIFKQPRNEKEYSFIESYLDKLIAEVVGSLNEVKPNGRQVKILS